MGLGELFARDTRYVATDTDTGRTETFTLVDNISPDWGSGEFQGGMTIPGAWRAALLLSDLLGAVPWHAYRERAGGPAEQMSPTPPLLDQPSPPDPRVTTFSSLALDLIWHGNAIAVVASRNRDGWPTSLLPVPAERVTMDRAGPGSEVPRGSVVYRIGSAVYAAADVIHVKGPCRPGALRGMGVLESHLTKTLGLADEQNKQARSLGTSGVPTGVLKSSDPDLEQEDATDLKTAWMTAQACRTVAVLNATTTFEPVAWNPSETQLLDARRFSLLELALIFGLPPYFLGADGGSNTYSNIEQEGLNLLKYSSLSGHLARFEQTFTLAMPRGTWARANLDSLLRADTLTRYQAHEIGIRAGFLTDDEAREFENRPPLTPAQREAARPPAPRPAAPDPAAVPSEGITP